MPPLAECAPAKISLALAITGRRGDGYHLLDTVAVFAAVGDRLASEPHDHIELTVDGPWAGSLAGMADNLVLRAATALAGEAQRCGCAVSGARLALTKNLPVAAGLGGGSADAAAALRLLNRLWGLDWQPERLVRLASQLGADVAMCLHSRALRARGIGDAIEFLDELPLLPLVLANPGHKLSTADVFAAFKQPRSSALPGLQPFKDARQLSDWLARTANDLEPAAIRLEPRIGDVLKALRDCEECLLARMSGSGATCFGLFPDPAAAEEAARRLRSDRPDWWVVATVAG